MYYSIKEGLNGGRSVWIYVSVLGFGASMGILTSVFIGLKIYNRKGKQTETKRHYRVGVNDA
ncbi:hypothetical protein ACT7DP_31150 [Bacillus paranthracis]